jgi:glycine/D-amino acid oxidase-like deaminating enzyme/nitrite reductase/ring-hydroxylating ferredoxin subunit
MTISGTTRSIWMTGDTGPADFPPLGAHLRCDVCVVGGGVAGLTTAYLLAREGRSVAVLDMDRIGGQETARTTAHLSDVLDEGLGDLEGLHGVEGAIQAVASHRAAITRIEEIVDSEGIACDFTRLDGYLLRAPETEAGELERELDAAQRLGFPDARLLSRTRGRGFRTGPCIRFPHQAQLHSLAYMRGLAEAIGHLGGKLFGHTRAFDIEARDGAVRVHTDGKWRVDAAAAVCATNTPFITRVALHTKQAAYRSYVIGARVPRGAVHRALYWDTADPYRYVRVQSDPESADSDIVIVGGEDHKTGQDDDPRPRFDRLEAWARKRVAALGKVVFRWSGQIMEPVDGLAFLGRSPGETDIYVITGDSGHGMTHGTIGAMIVSDLIAGRPNPWSDLYDPGRVTLVATPTFLQENLNVAAQYSDWIALGDIEHATNVAPGTGAVLRRGLARVVVYRRPDGTLLERSAVCPHLGCIVAWNPVESTWDCPCHGSRFTPEGTLVHGPAVADLSPVNSDKAGAD